MSDAPDLVREAQRAPRRDVGQDNRLQLALVLTAAVVLLLAALTVIVPGVQGGGYLWVRFWAGVFDFWQASWPYMLTGVLSIVLWNICGLFTIRVPMAAGPNIPATLERIWYRPFSLTFEGDLATWKTLGGTRGGCHRRYLTNAALFGCWHITTEMHVQPGSKRGAVRMLETANVEATQAAAVANRSRELAEEVVRLRLQAAGRRTE